MQGKIEKNFWLKCFGIAYTISLIVFSFYTVTFFFGNHDFYLMKFGTSVSQGVIEGRLTQFLLQYILFDNNIIPILNITVGLIFFVVATFMLAKILNIPENKFSIVSFSLLITINPYTLSQLYYVHTAVSILFWHLLVIAGFYLYTSNKQLVNSNSYYYVYTLLLWLIAICGYAPSIQMILTLLLLIAINDVIAGEKYLDVIKKYSLSIILFIVSIACYIIIVKFMQKIDIISHMYNTQHLPLNKIFFKLIKFWYKPFTILTSPIPYCYQIINYLIILAFILSVIICIKKAGFLIVIPIIALFYAMISLAFVSTINIFEIFRINMFSVPYVIAFFFFIPSKFGNRALKNITYITTIVTILGFSLACFEGQKIWHLGNIQDEKAMERVRQDLFKQIDRKNSYRLFIIGNLYGRAKFANKTIYNKLYKEKYREFFTYEYFLSHLFSSGLFFTENFNPVYADVFYSRDGMQPILKNKVAFLTSNEYMDQKDKERYWFIANYNRSYKSNVYNSLLLRKKEKIFIYGNDIIIYLSADKVIESSILSFLSKNDKN